MDDRAGMLEHSAVGGKEAGTLNKEHLHVWCGGRIFWERRSGREFPEARASRLGT